MSPQAHFSKIALVIVAAFAVVLVGFSYYVRSLERGYDTEAIFPDGTRIMIGIAKTDEERALGLSGRNQIGEKEGLYFLFPKEDRYGFWMKDMRFPIDIIWVRQGKIVGIEKNAAPEPDVPDYQLKVYSPPEPVSSVLEMNAGSADRFGLKAGDALKVQIVPRRRK